MALAFWQRPLSSIDIAALISFIEERAPEGEHLEYKMPTLNKQSSRVEWPDEILETLAAFANGGGGLLILGIRESSEKDSRPAPVDALKGVDLSAYKGGYKIDQGLLDTCADRIEPMIDLDTRVITIPEGELHAGNVVLLASVRPGRVPPYNLRTQGIYVRVGESDRHASVREIEALFQRRVASEVSQETGWERTLENVFLPIAGVRRDRPPFIMCALTPAFPIESIAVDQRMDDFFAEMLVPFLLPWDALVRLDNGVAFDMSYREEFLSDNTSYACAFSDGSVGLRWSLSNDSRSVGGPPLRLDAVGTWRSLQQWITWPRTLCDYNGPLTFRLAIGNIDNMCMIVPTQGHSLLPDRTPIINRNPLWRRQVQWEREESIDDVLEGMMESLARQLQVSNFRDNLPTIRSLVGQG